MSPSTNLVRGLLSYPIDGTRRRTQTQTVSLSQSSGPCSTHTSSACSRLLSSLVRNAAHLLPQWKLLE